MLIFCMATLVGSAQVQQLKDLENCINQTATHVSDSLVSKGWKLDAALTGAAENDFYRTFSFKTLKTDPTKAQAWLRLHTERTAVNRVYFQAPDEDSYLLLMKEIEAKKVSNTEPQVVEGQTITSMLGNDFAYQLITANGNYTIVVISKTFFMNHAREQ